MPILWGHSWSHQRLPFQCIYCLWLRCLAQLQWHPHNQCPGHLWLFPTFSPYPEWLGRVFCWRTDVSQFPLHQSQHTWWEILPCRCRIPHLLYPTCSILWCTISPFWMESCSVKVWYCHYLNIFATYTLQACHSRRVVQLTTCQGLEPHWESIWGDQVALQDSGHPSRIFHGCTGKGISHTCGNSQLYTWKGSHWDCWHISSLWWWNQCWRSWSVGNRISRAGRERQSQC